MYKDNIKKSDTCLVCGGQKYVEIRKINGDIKEFACTDIIDTFNATDEIRAVCGGCGITYKIESMESELNLPFVMG